MDITAAITAARSLRTEALEPLEKFLAAEKPTEMNLELYISILKLYQFYPAQSKHDIIHVILFKSVVLGIQQNAFTTCLYLVPERLMMVKYKEVFTLSDKLERAAYLDVWNLMPSYLQLAEKLNIKGIPLEDCIRRHAVRILAQAHTSMPLASFLEITHFADAKAATDSTLAKEFKYTVDGAKKVVVFPDHVGGSGSPASGSPGLASDGTPIE
eukprot:PhF_6_TR42640/c1_g1_i2/m.64143/K15028/EIF3K; translation initiation factor 3 subunit K